MQEKLAKDSRGLDSGVSSARDRRERKANGGREGWAVYTTPGLSSPAHGAWHLSGPPTPPRPSRLGLAPLGSVSTHLPRPPTPSPETPAPAVPGKGERAQGPGVPQNFLQVHSCASRPGSVQLPGTGKARARPGHSRPSYIRSRGGRPRPGPKGRARGAPGLASCTATATRRVPRAAPASGRWWRGAPCPVPGCTPTHPPHLSRAPTG